MLEYLMLIKFDISRTTLGRVPVGGVFTYDNKLWKVVNKIDGENKALITNVGSGCQPSFIVASSIKVCYIIKALEILEGTNESN